MSFTYFVYPGYREKLEVNSGTDFALIICLGNLNKYTSNDSLPTIDYLSALVMVDEKSYVEIAGFPGDKKGQFWGMTCPVKESIARFFRFRQRY